MKALKLRSTSFVATTDRLTTTVFECSGEKSHRELLWSMSLEDQEDQARHLSTMTHKEAIHGSERIFSAKYTDTTDVLESDRTRNIARHTAAPSLVSSHTKIARTRTVQG